MAENLYEIRVFGEIKGRYMKSSFDEVDKKLREHKFLDPVKLHKEIPVVNRDGYFEQIYEARLHTPLSEREVKSIKRIKSLADDLYIEIRVFKLEEIV